MKHRDPMDVYCRAMDLLRSGPYEEALKEFEWLQSHSLDLNNDFQPARRTFALAGWILLAEKFPPARVAIEELLHSRRRELATALVDVELHKDIAALETHIARLP